MDYICEQIEQGKALTTICDVEKNRVLPSSRTVLRYLKENEEAYKKYRDARTNQAELLRDNILSLVQAPLPDDPKLAMAEVQRRRLEADHTDKYIRQLQPNGLRDKPGDVSQSGQITLSWETGSVRQLEEG